MQTCPGSTPTCRQHCYARQHRFRFDAVKNKLRANLSAARQPEFWRRMVDEIRANGVKFLRIHSAGDWFSPEYVDQWHKIAKLCPDVVMWAYTRSWRKSSIRRRLRRLARLPNVIMYWSCDRDTGLPPKIPAGVRTAYLQCLLVDVPKAPVDLVFRTRNIRSTVAEEVDTPGQDSPVCPTETGLADAHDHHCSTCRACFTTYDAPVEPERRRVSLSLVTTKEDR